MGRRGFTLLEVMVAIAILGLTLTVILSAQGGLAASNKTAANMGVATALGRCKMTEIEEKLLKLGYPEIDDLQTDVSCCDDKDNGSFTCDTRTEKVVLPNPPDNSLDGGGGLLALGSAAASGSAGLGGLPGALSGMTGGLDFDGGGLQNLGQTLQQQMGGMGGGLGGAGGASGMLSMVMGIVYPSLKPMMEASIRRLTVKVKWREGPNRKDLTLVQYVTNPMRFAAGAMPTTDGGVPNGGVPTNTGGPTNPFGGGPPGGGAGSPFGGGPMSPMGAPR